MGRASELLPGGRPGGRQESLGITWVHRHGKLAAPHTPKIPHRQPGWGEKGNIQTQCRDNRKTPRSQLKLYSALEIEILQETRLHAPVSTQITGNYE